jgi:hypothetical protein
VKGKAGVEGNKKTEAKQDKEKQEKWGKEIDNQMEK